MKRSPPRDASGDFRSQSDAARSAPRGPQTQPDRLLTIAEAAALLGNNVSQYSLRAEVRAGRLKALRLRPGHCCRIYIRTSELWLWLDETASKRQIIRRPRKANPKSKERAE